MMTKWVAVIAALNLVVGLTSQAQEAQLDVIGSGETPVVEADRTEKPERPETEETKAEVKELVSEFNGLTSHPPRIQP